jgi:hypothetical protein
VTLRRTALWSQLRELSVDLCRGNDLCFVRCDCVTDCALQVCRCWPLLVVLASFLDLRALIGADLIQVFPCPYLSTSCVVRLHVSTHLHIFT